MGRFQEFSDRVPDAAPPEPEPDAEVLANLPDISGTHLLALAASIAPDPPFQFIATVDLHGDTVDIALVGLDRFDHTLLDMEPLIATDVPVDDTGEFAAQFQGVIDGHANVVTGNDLTVDVVLTMRIQDEDTFCGNASGMILKPIELDIAGSTAGAIRVDPGVDGDALPAPLPACPAE